MYCYIRNCFEFGETNSIFFFIILNLTPVSYYLILTKIMKLICMVVVIARIGQKKIYPAKYK